MKINFYAFLFFLFALFTTSSAEGTHLRGGYIYYTLDENNPRKAYFTMKIYNKESSPAEDPVVSVAMGDGVQVTVKRSEVVVVKPDVLLSLYKWEHTFGANGTYTVSWLGVNRNNQILNLAAPSDQYNLIITTTVTINPLNPNRHGVDIKTTLPVIAHPDVPLRFNLVAYDLDGDSLGYELVNPLHRNAEGQIVPVPGYKVPNGFGINRFGELYWENASTTMGAYTFAVQITQYRKGQAVGSTLFDMEFLVFMDSPSLDFPKAKLENMEELTFLKDGRLLVKPGEQVTLRFFFPQVASISWVSELQELGLNDVTFRSINSFEHEFTFTAPTALSRRQAYGVNFNFTFRHHTVPRDYVATLTIPILIWQPEEVELELLETENLPRTTEGYIASTPDKDIKVLLFAKNGLGNKTELAVESNLRNGAEHFSFVTRDSADSVVGELRFKPSESQISATPYTITLRSTSMQLRTSNGSAGKAQEVSLQVLVSAATPLSSGSDLSIGKLTLYPSPATDKFTIDAPELPALYLQLHDVHGKKVAGYNLQAGYNEMRRPATLSPGLYFYTLTSQTKPIQNGKLVLQ
ncbi:MAG: T9SS type A sorting domain-containing protein [Hymenobacteraceae bacterium]|nr:T9SS type A sorting domain-containing protein [Hymenobacteraceae bacterium]